jgi:MFS family permease
MTTQTQPKPITAAIIAGCIVAFLGFGFTATFGVFLRPMSADLGWGREVFSLSVAIQALCWGFTQPVAGMVADRYGSARVLAVGAILSALGFYLRGVVDMPQLFVLTGIIVGMGTGACSFPVVIVALGKIVTPQQRSFVMGLGTAAASLGMFIAAPASLALVGYVGWRTGIFVIAASFLLILPVLIFIARVGAPTAANASSGELGWSLGLIGLFNIIGSFGAGWTGQHLSKKWTLTTIYTSRAIVITAFLLVPISPASVYVFSAVMGVLWLSTVPLTMGLVAQTQGLTFLSTLVGMIFLGHQTGSFIGAWLGGRMYDITGDYSLMWWSAVVLGLLSALIHIPINERAKPQTA